MLTQAVASFKKDSEFKGAITIDGGGSLKGITEVAAGIVDIGNSDVSPMELNLDGTGLVDHQVAVVAVGVFVSPDVSSNLKEISSSDLKGIYTGVITDWKDVAGWKGTSLPITVYYQKSGSGIRVIFEKYAINTMLPDEQIALFYNFKLNQSPSMLQKDIEREKGVIGYEALPFCSKLKLLKVDGVEPTYENVYNGEYKIWGCEHMYTKGEPIGAAKTFIEYVTSEDFGETVTKNGYGLISEMKVSR
ncbi:MAG: substrate-binding domain-containing protein [Oscillospiraceae bacterium]